MRIEDHRWRIGSGLRRCLAIALVVGCAELINPQSMPDRTEARHRPSHKIHVSVTQIEFNQPKQAVEIVIRVFTDDLEHALSQRAGRAVKIPPEKAGQDRQAGALVMAYLRDSFVLKNKLGRPVKLAWAGIEGQPALMDMLWLYLEGRLPGGLEGAQLRNRIFCELFDDQVNIVNAKYQGKQFGLMFEAKDDFKVITGRAVAK